MILSFYSNEIKFFLVGAEACAPILVTEKAAAQLAKVTASTRDNPSANPTTSAPLKVSPAAVVSIAETSGQGTKQSSLSDNTKAPCYPIVIITISIPLFFKTVAASFAEVWSRTLIPVSNSASVSFGVMA